MGLMDKYNKGGVTFDIDITGFKFVTLAELFKQGRDKKPLWVDGLYINKKSSFGYHPVAIIGSEEILVDLPGHLTEDVKEMLTTAEIVEAIKNNKIGFTVQEYEQKKYKKTCYSIHWEEAL